MLISITPPTLFLSFLIIYPLKKLFNTSGQLYREMNMKDKVDDLTEAQAFSLLSKNGKLIKRPLAFDGNSASVGFKEEEYKSLWK